MQNNTVLATYAGLAGCVAPFCAGAGVPVPDIPACPGMDMPALLAKARQIALGGASAGVSKAAKGNIPLQSMFGRLNRASFPSMVPAGFLGKEPTMPQKLEPTQAPPDIPPETQKNLANKIAGLWKEIPQQAENIGYWLAALEECACFIPAFPGDEHNGDLTLYDHAHITAAIASALVAYCDAKQTSQMPPDEKEAFLLLSCDYSGIQSFVYNITSDKALRSLRGRSFALELLMEHWMDEVLDACGLSRANLIYAGGGNSYALLPNTKPVLEKLSELEKKFNNWVIENFEAGLFLAMGTVACSADDLMNHPAEETPYKKMFRNLGARLAAKKSNRYTAEQMRKLQNRLPDDGSRECKVCGISHNLEKDDICFWCDSFSTISSFITNPDTVIYCVDSKEKPNGCVGLQVPSANSLVWLCFSGRALQLASAPRRSYRINHLREEMYTTTLLRVGNYVYNPYLDKLAEESEGIRRMAVMRADVDNLGRAFISGFEREEEDPAKRYRYTNLSRTSMFSRQISLFFKYHLNDILAKKDRAAVVVYAGGDDLFLLGAWDDVISATAELQASFGQYTLGMLTLSAGIGMYREKFPVAAAASQTEELLDVAKAMDGKNAVCLFEANGGHCYSWPDFTKKVRDEKRKLLKDFFQQRPELENAYGNSFLYKVLQLLRERNERINIARLAYHLARMQPARNASAALQASYNKFSKDIMTWANSKKPNDTKELITAILLFVYANRGGAENE